METSAVRRRLTDTIERAKRTAAQRRTASDEASHEYSAFLSEVAVPLFRQLAGALKASGYPFSVNTPSGSVRLVSEKHPEDFIEISLDTTGDEPAVSMHTSHVRGRRIIEAERPIGKGPLRDLSEELLLDVVLKELEPFVEK